MIINSRSTFVIYLLFCTSSMTSLKKRIWAFYNLIYGIALTPGFTTRSPISNSSSFTLKIYQHLMFDLTPTKRLLNDSSKVSIHRFNVNFFLHKSDILAILSYEIDRSLDYSHRKTCFWWRYYLHIFCPILACFCSFAKETVTQKH